MTATSPVVLSPPESAHPRPVTRHDRARATRHHPRHTLAAVLDAIAAEGARLDTAEQKAQQEVSA